MANNNDIVTSVPVRAHAYRHVGMFWYIAHDGKLDDDINSWSLKLDRIKGQLEDFGETGQLVLATTLW